MECTPQHEARCRNARRLVCTCQCGGANHGGGGAIVAWVPRRVRGLKRRGRRRGLARQLALALNVVVSHAKKEEEKPVKLLTKELMRKLPPSQEGKGDGAIVYAKFFTPDSNWTWYVTEAMAVLDEETEVPLKEVNGRGFIDVRFFGLVEGHARELGYFSLRELESARGPLGLPIERDRYWSEVPLKAV